MQQVILPRKKSFRVHKVNFQAVLKWESAVFPLVQNMIAPLSLCGFLVFQVFIVCDFSELYRKLPLILENNVFPVDLCSWLYDLWETTVLYFLGNFGSVPQKAYTIVDNYPTIAFSSVMISIVKPYKTLFFMMYSVSLLGLVSPNTNPPYYFLPTKKKKNWSTEIQALGFALYFKCLLIYVMFIVDMEAYFFWFYFCMCWYEQKCR